MKLILSFSPSLLESTNCTQPSAVCIETFWQWSFKAKLDPSDTKIYRDLKNLHMGGTYKAMLLTESRKKRKPVSDKLFKVSLRTFLPDTEEISTRKSQCHCYVALHAATRSNKSCKASQIHN